MKNQRKAFLCFAVLGLFLFCITTAASAQNAEQIAEKALAATVYLEMTDSNDQSLGFGSGFFVGPNQVATNFHVIEGAAKGTAKLVRKSTKYTIKGEYAIDEENDLAILDVRMEGIQPLSLGDSDAVKIGQTVYVAGNPEEQEGTFSPGMISSLREEDGKKRLQMTAPISPGSSGGPVLNSKGEVIGISFKLMEEGQNLNFAIPSNYLKELLTRSDKAKPWPPEESRSAKTYFRRGNAKSKLGLYNAAIANYDEAIRLIPDFAEAYFNRGNAKSELGLYKGAIADYDEAIRLIPDFAEAYFNRGNTKDDLDQYTAAIADYDEAIRLKPDYAEAYYNRGLVKSELGLYKGAIADYDMAIRLIPSHAYAYYKRGIAKGNLERIGEAKQDLQTALKLAEQAGDESLKADIEELLQTLD